MNYSESFSSWKEKYHTRRSDILSDGTFGNKQYTAQGDEISAWNHQQEKINALVQIIDQVLTIIETTGDEKSIYQILLDTLEGTPFETSVG